MNAVKRLGLLAGEPGRIEPTFIAVRQRNESSIPNVRSAPAVTPHPWVDRGKLPQSEAFSSHSAQQSCLA